MKNILLVIICSIVFALYSQSQQIKVFDLNIPTSPAFVLTDQSPTSIEKPSDPKALSLSIVNLIQGGAMEVSPYWLQNRPALTFNDYFKNRHPVLQTLAFSVATFKKDSITQLSVGFRTQIFRYYSESTKTKINLKKTQIVALLAAPRGSIDMEAIAKAKNELTDLKSKSTVNIEIAGAYLGQSNSYKSLAPSKESIWLNAKYSPTKIPFDFTVLARYSKNIGAISKTEEDSSFFDYGINLCYQDNHFNLSLEYVNRRNNISQENFDRLAFVANYQVAEGLVVFGAFGKNFDKTNNIISILGVKFAISKEKISL